MAKHSLWQYNAPFGPSRPMVFSDIADMAVMTPEQRREARIQSRGELIIFCPGEPEFPASIVNTSINGIAVLAGRGLPMGSPVRIEIHGHTAQGVVQHCRPKEDGILIGIALQPPPDESDPPS